MAAEQPRSPESLPAEALSPDARWRPAPTAAWTRLDTGAAVVMDTRANRPQALDPVGSVIWDVLLDGLTPDDDLASAAPRTGRAVAHDVAAEFGADPAAVLPDVLAFLERLAGLGVLTREG